MTLLYSAIYREFMEIIQFVFARIGVFVSVNTSASLFISESKLRGAKQGTLKEKENKGSKD